MAKNPPKTVAAEAALDAASTAAKDAKRAAKGLPKADARELQSLAAEAKNASAPSKKKIRRKPTKVVATAIAAVARIAKALGRAESRAEAGAGAPEKKPATTKKSSSPQAATPSKPKAESDLSSLTVAQLKERAAAAGHTGYSRYTKAQLIELLSQ